MHVIKESKKFIKPSTPTPPSLRQFNISFIDEFAPNVSLSIVLFFSVDNNNNLNFVSRLEKSLEKILTPFYPFAGRYVEETQTIDCNDQGAEFIKATCNAKLQVLLDFKDVKVVDRFIPNYSGALNQAHDPLLSVLVTTFECGGIALGVSLSHKLVDGSTISTFLNKWGDMTREENEVEFTQLGINSPSLFPARGLCPLDLGLPTSTIDDVLKKYVTLKFSFSDIGISSLNDKVVLNQLNDTTKWSKEQLVSALILKGFIGVDRAIQNCPRDCILLRPINFREKTASSIPKDTCGNLWGISMTECGKTETTEELADLLTDSFKKFISNFSKLHHDDDEGQTIVLNSFSHMGTIPPMTNVIWLSSWCNFPFYEADFGFGKPIWASCGSILNNNTVVLMDTVGGNGVEAYVCLEVNNVHYFEKALGVNGVDA